MDSVRTSNPGKLRLGFAGTPQFAADHLQSLIDDEQRVVIVFTQPDRPGKRGKTPISSPVKILANSLELPLSQPARLAASNIDDLDLDVLIVVAFGQILRSEVLRVPKYGCINVHASYLPRWRGASPIHQAILAGDKSTGVSIIQMNAGLDTGDVLHQIPHTIGPEDNAGMLEQSLSAIGQTALRQTLTQIVNGSLAPVPQDEACATYANKLTKKEAEIDWHQEAGKIVRMVRAFNPAPVAYTRLDDLRIKIWEAEVVSVEAQERPGLIVGVDRNGVLVNCNSNQIYLRRLQLPIGKGRVLSGADLVNGRDRIFVPGRCFASPSSGLVK